MKGTSGLILAIFLGALAMLFNWAYLESKLSEVKTVSLAGIAAGVKLEKGEALREDHLVEVKVPLANAATLESIAYLYEDRKSLLGMRAVRNYESGDIILRRDYRTSPTELTLAQDERLIWIPVDSRSFVPELLNPGDRVTFLVPLAAAAAPVPASATEDESEEVSESVVAAPPAELKSDDSFGPFSVASVGSRLASQSLAQSIRTSTMQDRQIGIIVDPKNEKNVMKLLDRLERNSYRHVNVMLHPRTPRGEP